MVQRGFWEAQTTLESERRHAGMVRRLSAFLADASLAAGRPDALAETLRLVVEQGRELLDAHACRGVLRLEGQRQLSATSIASGGSERDWASADEWPDLPAVHGGAAGGTHRRETVLQAELTALDGRRLGALIAESGGGFSESDEAILVHLAQMASAAVERAAPYQPRSHPA